MSKKERTDRETMKSLARCDEGVEHDDGCGHCFYMKCQANAARKIIASRNYDNCIKRFCDITKTLWEAGKYYKLYQKEVKAGRDPHEKFIKKGWEM